MDISVVIPCYNGEKFIKEAIDSINSQTFPPKEIVIVNDGSHDNSLAILEDCQKRNEIPIKVISQVNGGVSSARNVGIASATGEWIAFLDVDDLWYPEKLAVQTAIIDKSSDNIALICCDYHIDEKIDSSSKYNTSKYISNLLERELDAEEFQLAFIEENFIGTATTMLFRRDLALRNGCFDVLFNHSEDFDFILRLSQFGSIYLINRPLALKRHHGANLTDDLALYYFSHAVSLQKNISTSGHYFRSNYTANVISAMKNSYDDCLVNYANQIFERKALKGLLCYFSLFTKVYTVSGLKKLLFGFAKKLIRFLSFNLIKNK